MKKNVILSSLLIVFATLGLTGCSKDEPHSVNPSPRDGLYEGKNLTVSLDGEPVTTVKSVRILSEILGYGYDENGFENISDPYFHTIVEITGFPTANENFRFNTISNLYGFEGTLKVTDAMSPSLAGEYLNFEATFTGYPFASHDLQGLIIQFNKTENPL